ncbi:HNH endonuclease [Kribbella alba]|uniref:HNH endonuclease n=1 Tax=Kribbella alba TaxID=190197 RepID=UPI003CD05A15
MCSPVRVRYWSTTVAAKLLVTRHTAHALTAVSRRCAMGRLQAMHPRSGAPFDENGFPDFSDWRHPDGLDIRIELSGSRSTDFARANRAAGLDRAPEGYMRHHHQDLGLMQLIECDAHRLTGHTGGFSGGR